MKRARSLIYTIFGVLSVFSAYSALAANSCGTVDLRSNVAYQITGPKFSILTSDRPLARNKNVPFQEMVGRIKSNIDKFHGDLPEITNEKLAVIAAAAADSVGVDPAITSSIIGHESFYCKKRLNPGGGDSGCMQFTTAALNELKEQFGYGGKDKFGREKFAAGVPQALRAIVSDFYRNAPEREKQFYAWLAKPTTAMRVQLRTGDDQDIDILAGAISLKVKLAAANGNYALAVRNYNGSKLRDRYSRDVMSKAMNVNYDESLCDQETRYVREIFANTCDVSGDSSCYMNDPNFSEDLSRGQVHGT